MKLIPLTKGKFAKVDDEDYEMLSKQKWCAHLACNQNYYYAECKGFNGSKITTISMHRVIMNQPKDMMVDHKDGDTLNNQKLNLRVCNSSQNNANRRPSRNGTSKYLGVQKRGPRWRVRISKDMITISIGTFSSEKDAALAYNEAAIKFHGEFSRLNIID